MKSNDHLNNINSLRTVATFLLVGYHVVGPSSSGGMQVSDSSGWRLATDLLLDIRMPLFAFIAGAVYSLRPISLLDIGGFVSGKFFRLYVPGVFAGLFFLALGRLHFKDAFSADDSLLEVLTLASGHFWFLQSILIILIFVGIIDALLRYRASHWLFVFSTLIMLAWSYLNVPFLGYLMLSGVVYLTPFFLLGVTLIRYADDLKRWRHLLVVSAVCLLLFGLKSNFDVLAETGRFSLYRRDLQSLTLGVGTIMLAYFFFPRVRFLDNLAVYTFAIYLYHPLGTSAARRVFDAIGFEVDAIRFLGGVGLGFALPILLHLLSVRNSWISRVIFGLRIRKPSRGKLV